MQSNTEEMERKLGLAEFKEVFFDNLGTLITNENHITNNYDFYEDIIFKCFEMYQKQSSVYIVTDFTKILNIFLKSLFLNQPDTELPEDVITIS